MSYGLLLRESGSKLTTMEYFTDEDTARQEFNLRTASGKYSMVELIEFKRLVRWENHA